MKPTVSLGGESVPSSLSYSLYQNTLGDCQSFGMGLYKKPTHLQHGFCSIVVVLGFCLFWSACNSQRWGECPTACMWRSEGYTVLEWALSLRNIGPWDQTQVTGLVASSFTHCAICAGHGGEYL